MAQILLFGPTASELKHCVCVCTWEIQKGQNRDLRTKQVIDQKYTWTQVLGILFGLEDSREISRGPIEQTRALRRVVKAGGESSSLPQLHHHWYPLLLHTFYMVWEGERGHVQLKF